jgi:hypothetical protein
MTNGQEFRINTGLDYILYPVNFFSTKLHNHPFIPSLKKLPITHKYLNRLKNRGTVGEDFKFGIFWTGSLPTQG